jgi:hypothetical protein
MDPITTVPLGPGHSPHLFLGCLSFRAIAITTKSHYTKRLVALPMIDLPIFWSICNDEKQGALTKYEQLGHL